MYIELNVHIFFVAETKENTHTEHFLPMIQDGIVILKDAIAKIYSEKFFLFKRFIDIKLK